MMSIIMSIMSVIHVMIPSPVDIDDILVPMILIVAVMTIFYD